MPRSIKILFNSNRKEDVDFMSVLAKITSLLNIFVSVYVCVCVTDTIKKNKFVSKGIILEYFILSCLSFLYPSFES